jgi:hypothetical protein
MVSTNSRSLPVSDPTFQVPTCALLGSASILTLHICRVKCEDPCSFFTTPGRGCSVSLRMRRPDPYSLNTISRSRYGTPPRGWRPGYCPFNIIPGFQYGVSLRGLRPKDFPCGFISIEMAKIVVGSPGLTQPLLLYPGLGPAMLDNIGGVSLYREEIELESQSCAQNVRRQGAAAMKNQILITSAFLYWRKLGAFRWLDHQERGDELWVRWLDIAGRQSRGRAYLYYWGWD